MWLLVGEVVVVRRPSKSAAAVAVMVGADENDEEEEEGGMFADADEAEVGALVAPPMLIPSPTPVLRFVVVVAVGDVSICFTGRGSFSSGS